MELKRINLPEDLYKAWLEEETNKIEPMDMDTLQAHIETLEQASYELKTRLQVGYVKRIKLMGADWANNSRSISAPDFRVNNDGDPRRKRDTTPKKSKEEREAETQASLGIDKNKLKELIKQKMLEKKAKAAGLDSKGV